MIPAGMRSDRELLELAAKAAGIVIHAPSQKRRDDAGYGHVGLWTADQTCWNPLTSDADALRLMARLNINVSYRENINGAWVVAEHEGIEFCPESLDGPHEDDATRRAIVRAAAAMASNPIPTGDTP